MPVIPLSVQAYKEKVEGSPLRNVLIDSSSAISTDTIWEFIENGVAHLDKTNPELRQYISRT